MTFDIPHPAAILACCININRKPQEQSTSWCRCLSSIPQAPRNLCGVAFSLETVRKQQLLFDTAREMQNGSRPVVTSTNYQQKKRRRSTSASTRLGYSTTVLLLLLGTTSASADDTHVLRSARRETDSAAPISTSSKQSSTQKNITQTATKKKSSNPDPLHTKFMTWSEQVMGIHSILEIAEFEYPAVPPLSDDDLESDLPHDSERFGSSIKGTTYSPTPSPSSLSHTNITVRGLAASRDISHGEVLLEIPMQALFSIHVVIDQDPVLRPILSDYESDQQVAVLAVALLHHVRLGDDSPLAPYIRMLTSADRASLPSLWTATELRTQTTVAVRRVTKRLRQEMWDAYATTVMPRMQLYPSVLDETAFGYGKFQWAYAIVNSRHWQLPIGDDAADDDSTTAKNASSNKEDAKHHGSFWEEHGVVPPADTPTDAWVRTAHDDDDDDESIGLDDEQPLTTTTTKSSRSDRSFLAPVADLLNLGPPCTRIQYDAQQFQVVATCDFVKGQEVTFWYGDACADVVMAVYGVNSPSSRPCQTATEWKHQAEELERLLDTSYLDLELLETELDTAEERLAECCNEGMGEPPHIAVDDVVDASTTDSNGPDRKERRRIRRTWSSSRKEDDADGPDL